MTGKHRFKVGQRVRPSEHAIFSGVVKPERRNVSGVIKRVDERNFPTVLWDDRKTPIRYYHGFVRPDRRRRKKP